MRKVSIISLLSILIIILLLSSCSLFIDGYNRSVAYNSICWEDNDHILVYANIGAYRDLISIGGDTREYVWTGGEIWRIDVNTGDKKLLIRRKGEDYTFSRAYTRIVMNKYIMLIGEAYNSYKISENYNEWDSIGYYIYPNLSDEGNYIVGLENNLYETDYIKKYNVETGNEEILYEIDDDVMDVDYDFNRNLLLVNGVRLIDLNTGVDTVLLHEYDKIGAYTLYETEIGCRYGKILENEISMDVYTASGEYNKVYVGIDSINSRRIFPGLRGVESPDGSKYAYISVNSNIIEIYNGWGTKINEIELSSYEI